MGTRGRIPKPTALKLLEGNPGKRPINKLEPKPRSIIPTCPAHLDDIAKKEWRRLVPILLRMKVLTEADRMPLANLCQAFSTMVQAQEKLNASGLLIKVGNSYVQQNPLLSIVNSCCLTITALSREFGLTPASRSRIQVAPEGGGAKDRDDILDF